jgi:hypothetical protein
VLDVRWPLVKSLVWVGVLLSVCIVAPPQCHFNAYNTTDDAPHVIPFFSDEGSEVC